MPSRKSMRRTVFHRLWFPERTSPGLSIRAAGSSAELGLWKETSWSSRARLGEGVGRSCPGYGIEQPRDAFSRMQRLRQCGNRAVRGRRPYALFRDRRFFPPRSRYWERIASDCMREMRPGSAAEGYCNRPKTRRRHARKVRLSLTIIVVSYLRARSGHDLACGMD